MSFPSVVNCVYLVLSCITCLSAAISLTIVIIFRKRCCNFPTLLVCNTILGIFIYSADHVAISVYMFIWDRQIVPDIDSLCPLRAYLHHTMIAFIHHSLVLQAIKKYLRIKRIELLNTKTRQIVFVLAQWIFDYGYVLPVFLTGNMEKTSLDNLCFISFAHLHVVFVMATLTFIVPDISLIILYRLLVRYARTSSSKFSHIQNLRMNRELTVIRRIMALHGLLVIVDSPAIIFIILNATHKNLLPQYCIRFLLLLMGLPLVFQIIVLCRHTTDIRLSFSELYDFIVKLLMHRVNRVTPIRDANHF